MHEHVYEEFAIEGLLFRMTCQAFPEQYNVINGRGRQVGYLRLRHGRFYVACPDVEGDIILEHEFAGEEYKGQFDGNDERGMWLVRSARAINQWRKTRKLPKG